MFECLWFILHTELHMHNSNDSVWAMLLYYILEKVTSREAGNFSNTC